MNLKQHLTERMTAGRQKRLEKLKEIQAPDVIIENQVERVAAAKAGDFSCYKDFDKYADCEVIDFKVITGRGGKKHIKFTLNIDGKDTEIGLFTGPYSDFFKPWENKK
jgi:hypothetical protein